MKEIITQCLTTNKLIGEYIYKEIKRFNMKVLITGVAVYLEVD